MSNKKKPAEQSRQVRAQAAIRRQKAVERSRNVAIGGVVVGVLVVVVVVAYLFTRSSDTTGATPDAVPSGTTNDYGVVVGKSGAGTQMVFYEDPQCPICKQFEATVGDKVATAVDQGDVSVEYRVVSFLDDASSTDYSSRAANALLAVQDVAGPDAFIKMHDLLYENQPEEGSAGLPDSQLVDYAVQAGADEAEVRPLIEDKAFAQWIKNATDAMSKNDVTGTPTVFIDGKKAGDNPQQSVDAVLKAVGG